MRTEDGHIINRCLNGDPAAFGFLVDKYKESVYAFAYDRLRNFHDAEDVTQEVFLKAYQRLRTLRRWDSFLAWLYSITSNVCKMWIRAQSRRPDSEFIEDEGTGLLASRSVDSYREGMRRELLRDMLDEALDSLPGAYRQVLIFHYLGGMSNKEIARFLGTSPTAVKQRLMRARSRLREEMLAMMSRDFEERRLPVGFTFNIVESVKRMKIQPMPRTAGFPWGVSLATGIVIAVLSLGSHLSLPNSLRPFMDSALPNELVVMELGEVPVEVLGVSQMPSVSIKQGYGNYGEYGLSAVQNAVFLAPGDEGDRFPEKPSGRLGKGSVLQIAYSPDGKLLAVGGGLGIWLYDAENLNEVALLEGGHIAKTIAFSPNGKLIASGSWDSTIQLWDVFTKELVANFTEHTDDVYSVAFSPDGKTLASGSWDNTIRLWDMDDKEELEVLEQEAEVYPEAVAFSPDGKMLAAGNWDKTIRLWNWETKKEIDVLPGHTGQIWSVAFSPDGKTLASGSEDKTVRVWDLESGTEIAVLRGHTDVVWSAAFSPDGRLLASGSIDGNIRLWDVREQKSLTILQGDARYLLSVAFRPDGKRIAAGGGGDIGCIVVFWDVSEQKQIAALDGYTERIRSMALSPDGKIIALGGDDGAVGLWNLDEQKPTGVLKGHTDRVYSIAFSPDGKLIASGSDDGTVRLWDMQKQVAVFGDHGTYVLSVAFSPDGRTLASGSADKNILLWDVDERNQVGILQGHSSWVRSVAFSPDGELLASGGEDKSILLWDVDRQMRAGALIGHTGGVQCVAFSLDGRILASGATDNTVRLWDVEKQTQLTSLQGHKERVLTVAFSPDGRILASAGWEDTIRIWDVNEQKQLAVLNGYAGANSIAFSPAGKWLVSGGSEGAVLLWEVNVGGPGIGMQPEGKRPGTWGEMKRAALFQNFPNPFNPETWIPFSLSEPEHVKISICSSTGQLVRTLDLGEKLPGAYLSKDKAVYWDGTNEEGEEVASGTYFYTIKAGEFEDSRKMIVLR